MSDELTGPERCMIFKPVSFRTAREPHKVTCAGCDCEPGTTCDTQIRCGQCQQSKTYCDSLKDSGYRNGYRDRCCSSCDH